MARVQRARFLYGCHWQLHRSIGCRNPDSDGPVFALIPRIPYGSWEVEVTSLTVYRDWLHKATKPGSETVLVLSSPCIPAWTILAHNQLLRFCGFAPGEPSRAQRHHFWCSEVRR